VLLAAGLTVQVSWPRLATTLLIGATVLNAAVIVERGGSYRSEDWRQAQAFVATQARPGDGIAFAPTPKAVSYEYYQVRTDKSVPEPVLPAGRWGDVRVTFDKLIPDRPSDVTSSAGAISGHDRMWLVIASGPGGGPRQGFLQSLKDALGAAGNPTGRWQFGRVNVQLYGTR
jgi:hypothetical protein